MKKTVAALTLPLLLLTGAPAAAADRDSRKKQTITRSQDQTSSTGAPQYFTGEVRVDTLFADNADQPYSGGSVTFQPGARSAWHSHPTGQRLVVTDGVGRTQQWGGAVQEIRAGDVVWCPPGVKHWHGASPDTAMTHTALTGVRNGQNATWMEKVSDKQYNAAVAHDHQHGHGALSEQHAATAAIAAFTAGGDLQRLPKSLNDGLDTSAFPATPWAALD